MNQALKDQAPELAKALVGWKWQDHDDNHDDSDVIKISSQGAWFFIRLKDAKAATGRRAHRYARAADAVMDAGHRGNITPSIWRWMMLGTRRTA